MCNIEFPHFGASYPDACCIDGYLWDMDSYEDDYGLTLGGDDPCPFCNTDKWLKDVVGSVFDTEEEALVWMRKMRAKYGDKE